MIGQIETRQYKGKWIQEVVSESLLLLRNIDWERGESIRQQYNLPSPNGTSNDVFIVGEVLQGIQLESVRRSLEKGGGEFAFLRLRLRSDEYLTGLRVTVAGTLAELVHPYLQTGSKIAVDGSLQTHDLETGKQVVEVRARNMTFLENINWEAGKAAQLMRQGNVVDFSEVGAMVYGD